MILELRNLGSHWMVSQHYEPFRNWYLIQTAVDPAARTKKFDDKLMRLIRFVSSQVGHTLITSQYGS
jgi:hypothetical protein